jgi:CMP-N,N'-diacetyllegionaminic acid synthase
MTKQPSALALIPARSGSRRVPHKNVRRLAGHPLLAYTISAARASGVFAAVVVSTDDEEYASIARHYGAVVPALRSTQIAGETSPDIEWVLEMLSTLTGAGQLYDCFSILRPTSPFRRPETIRRAWAAFLAQRGIDSLRAVEKCKQHPGKMWVIRGERMMPLLPLSPAERPWHSQQYAALPEVYIQNASLEIAWTRVALEGGTIAGNVIVPFLTQDLEGVDVNDSRDWDLIERLVAERPDALPEIAESAYTGGSDRLEHH